ncbi:hypothetical protein COL55_13290 [Bacillus toyonensis]|uniref:hypothetical protein n=1 Tax=Bacillus toyonensis TaxID=155322 RepID=UPI000BF8C1EA|nr:hypothetical protein [Bacillus toyonensis]PFY49076.1 hypothetical protein COL55_13290 [Bacillus toyonensis]
MSKVNVDEINAGDLVSYYSEYFGANRIGYVTGVSETKVWAWWSRSKEVIHGNMPLCRIDGHWKVINFEEESKVDELKVYTGKETVQALLDGKTLSKDGSLYRVSTNGTLEVDMNSTNEWEYSRLYVSNLLTWEFTEVVLPQVGDWVKVTCKTNTFTGKLISVSSNGAKARWNDHDYVGYLEFKLNERTWQILSPEQITEYKREQAFSKVGRKLNEFREGDIVMIDSLGVTAIVVSKKNDPKVQLHGINQVGKGHVAHPHQLTPIFFTESQVDLS